MDIIQLDVVITELRIEMEWDVKDVRVEASYDNAGCYKGIYFNVPIAMSTHFHIGDKLKITVAKEE